MADINKIKLPSGAEYNIKDYRIPGVDTTPTSGSNNIVTSGGIYSAINTAIGSVYRVKGTKATYAELPSSGNVAGDVWNVTAAYGNYPAGTNWVWTGSAWDALGGEIDLSGKQDVLTFDSTPTANSTNPVTSGGVYDTIEEIEEVTAAALNDLNDRIDSVQSDLSDIDAPGTLTTTSTAALSTATNETLSGSINLHKVAKTGTYSDLIGKPAIPAAPGTLNTTANTAQSTNASETLSGSVTLHKIAKTGTYSDLIGTPFKAGSSGSASVVHNHKNDGHPSTATGDYSLAFGIGSNATDTNAVALGSNSNASGHTSFAAIGGSASGTYSSAIGTGTYSQNYGEVAIGRYNVSSKASNTTGNAGNTAFSVGIGVNGGRSNAVQVMQNGDMYIKGIGSYNGTNTSASSTLQTVIGNIPSAVTESTVSGWGFTKNTGTVTGVNFNGTNATVANGIATITSIPVIVLTWNANDTLTFPSNVNPSSIPNNVPIIVTGDGFANAFQTIESGLNVNYGLVTNTFYEPENTEEELGQSFEIDGMFNYGAESISFYAYFETSFGGSTFSKTDFFGHELFSKGNITTSFYGGIGITHNTVPSAVLVWNTFQALPQILSGTADPTSAQGNNGDIYIKLSS